MRRGKDENDRENKHKLCNYFSAQASFQGTLGWKQALPKIINCEMCPAHLSETFNYRVEAGRIKGLT